MYTCTCMCVCAVVCYAFQCAIQGNKGGGEYISYQFKGIDIVWLANETPPELVYPE